MVCVLTRMTMEYTLGRVSIKSCEFLESEELNEKRPEVVLRDSFCKLQGNEIAAVRCFYPEAMTGWKKCFLRLRNIEKVQPEENKP